MMASGLTLDAVLMWSGLATAVTAVGGALWRLARGVARTGRRVDQFMDDWYGEPERPGVPARPGMLERVQGIEAEQVSLRGEVGRATRILARLCAGCDDDPEPDADPAPAPGE